MIAKKYCSYLSGIAAGAKRKLPETEFARNSDGTLICESGDKHAIEGVQAQDNPKSSPFNSKQLVQKRDGVLVPSLGANPSKFMKNKQAVTLKEVWSKGLHKSEQIVDLDKIDIKEQAKLLEDIDKMQSSWPEHSHRAPSAHEKRHSKSKPLGGEKGQLDIASMFKRIAKPEREGRDHT